MFTAVSEQTLIPRAKVQTTGPKKTKVHFLTSTCLSKTVNTSCLGCFPFSGGK